MIDARQSKRQRRIAPFFFPNQFRFPHTPPCRARRASPIGRADRKPVLQPERRLANRTLLHGGDKIQHVAARLAGETVKGIFAEAGPEGIVALAPVNRTTADQLMAVFPQARHLVIAQHGLQAHSLFHRGKIHPAPHLQPWGGRSEGPSMVTVWQ
jgi:hypothetical protein